MSNGSWESISIEGHCYDYELAKALCLRLELMNVQTIADFGCGPGWYVKTLWDAGFEVNGYDGNPHTEHLSRIILQDSPASCTQMDLSQDAILDNKVDLVLSLEVGEHIPEEFEDIYINNLVQNTKKYILISWATIGQGGEGHVNCRDNEYVINRLLKLGFVEIIPLKNYLRSVAELSWFKNTILAFQRIE